MRSSSLQVFAVLFLQHMHQCKLDLLRVEKWNTCLTVLMLCLALFVGPGSGKTRVVINRMFFFIEEKKIKPNRILAVTFTNKAVNEMKQRHI